MALKPELINKKKLKLLNKMACDKIKIQNPLSLFSINKLISSNDRKREEPKIAQILSEGTVMTSKLYFQMAYLGQITLHDILL